MQAYEIVHEAYRSSKTVVCYGKRRSDELPVVLKLAADPLGDPASVAAIQHEHDLLIQLRGPGVPSALDLCAVSSSVALVIEDQAHRPLPPAPLPLEAWLHTAIGVTRALARVHAKGIVHRDVNPNNLLARPSDGDVVLIDFGIAGPAQPDEAPADFRGTWAYVSPEQTGRTQLGVDARSDLYSLGVTLFELLAGERPFHAGDALGYVHAHLSRPPPPLRSIVPDTPEVVEQLVARLLEKDPGARYQSARGLLHDLEVCHEHWRASGAIPRFELASRDGATLTPPATLLEHEHVLKSIIDEPHHGLVLVVAAEGCGKSALLEHVRRQRSDSAVVVSGPCSETLRETPWGPWRGVLDGLTAWLLLRPDDELPDWRERLVAALGSDLGALLGLVPSLAHVCGAADTPASSDTAQLDRAIGSFLEVFARRTPLWILLDDLQWADDASADLLASVSAAGHAITVVATTDDARSDVVGGILDKLREQREDAVAMHTLRRLSGAGVRRFVAASLHTTEDSIEALADIVVRKTGGNPLFVSELLKRLVASGALWPEGSSWAWDHDAVVRTQADASVVGLMVGRLQHLESEVVEVLRLGACTGGHFDQRVVAALHEGPVSGPLATAADAGLISPVGDDGWQFAHRAIRAALLGAQTAETRATLRYRAARFLVDNLDEAERTRRIFEIVAHLAAARRLLISREQRTEHLELLLVAAEQARAVAGHALAATHLTRALDALSEAEWAEDPVRHQEVRFQLAQVRLATGALDEADQLCADLLPQVHDPLRLAEIHQLRAAVASQRGAMQHVLTITREGLAVLGVTLPETPEDIGAELGQRMGAMVAALHATPPEELTKLPDLTDPVHIATMDLLYQATPAAFQVAPPLFVLIELMMFERVLEHGVAPSSAKMFADLGIMLVGQVGDPALGVRLADLADALVERFRPSGFESAVAFVNGAFVRVWKQDLQVADRELERAYRVGVEIGDGEHAAWGVAFHAIHASIAGRPLPTSHEVGQEALAYTRKVGSLLPEQILVSRQVTVAALMDSAQGLDEIVELIEGVGEAGPKTTLLYAAFHLTWASLLLGRIDEAQRWLVPLLEHQTMAPSLLVQAPATLLRGLLAVEGGSSDPEGLLETLAACTEQASGWATHNPTTFGPMRDLLAAELARARGEPPHQIAALYEAVVDAEGPPFLYLRGLASERHASLWATLGHPRFARTLLDEAHLLYTRWGASAVVERLERQHPHLRGRTEQTSTTTTTASPAHGALDVESVVKATRAISREVKPERLFSALITTILENAGAQRACLVLPGGTGLRLEACAGVDHAPVVQSVALEDAASVARTVVSYVARTHEPVVLGNARRNDRFARDPHVRAHQVRSLLCLPVLGRGELLAVLYAENNAMSDAFTVHHVRILQIIAGQAATSIRNAQMYERLEHLVEERTRELGARNQEIEALFDNLPQGVLTIDRDLRIEPRYSARLPELVGLGELTGRDASTVLFRDAELTADERASHDAALRVSFGAPALFATVNWVHLVRRMNRSLGDGSVRSFELDWSPLVDEQDDVVRVLATVRDVTALRALEREASERGRELERLREILQAGVPEFQRFCRESRATIADNRVQLEGSDRLSADTTARVFRHLHTLKGNARMLGLREIAATAHEVEEPWMALRHDPGQADRRALIADLGTLVDCIHAHEQVLQRNLGDLLDRKEAHASPGEATMATIVARAARGLPSLAEELGKPPPELTVEGGDIAVRDEHARILGDALVHVLRNALDHGIEAPERRADRGKPPRGHITIRAEVRGGRIMVRVHDDGAGLAMHALRAKLPPDTPDTDVAQSIFASGTSTAAQVTNVSGRGVGMDAVRSFIEERGGHVAVALTENERDGHRPFELHLELPHGELSPTGNVPGSELIT